MLGFTVVLVFTVLVCLAFEATKIIGVAIGVAGIVVLIWLHPLGFLALLVLGGVGFFIYKRRVFHARPKHELPKLHDRCD